MCTESGHPLRTLIREEYYRMEIELEIHWHTRKPPQAPDPNARPIEKSHDHDHEDDHSDIDMHEELNSQISMSLVDTEHVCSPSSHMKFDSYTNREACLPHVTSSHKIHESSSAHSHFSSTTAGLSSSSPAVLFSQNTALQDNACGSISSQHTFQSDAVSLEESLNTNCKKSVSQAFTKTGDHILSVSCKELTATNVQPHSRSCKKFMDSNIHQELMEQTHNSDHSQTYEEEVVRSKQ